MKRYVLQVAKNIKDKITTHQHFNRTKLQANKVLKSIELVKGKTDSTLIKQSDEYSKDMFGDIGFAPWLYVYSAVAGTFKEGWLPDNYYGKVVVPAIKGSYGKVSEQKPLTNRIFRSTAFPDIAYYVNGLFFSNDYGILSENEIKDYLFKISDRVVFKTDKSLQGRGVFIVEKSTFDRKKVNILGNGVFQSYIDQHTFFDELMPTSVATIRISTVIDNIGHGSVRSSYLRIGRSTDTHVKSASHIRIPINIETGELNSQGYLTSWHTIDRHPDSGVIFAKKKLPNFNKCASTALELHRQMPFARCIGWDIIVDKNFDVKVMEWNGAHNDIKFSESTQGPCFSGLGWENLWRDGERNF